MLLNKKYVRLNISYNMSETFHILRRIRREINVLTQIIDKMSQTQLVHVLFIHRV